MCLSSVRCLLLAALHVRHVVLIASAPMLTWVSKWRRSLRLHRGPGVIAPTGDVCRPECMKFYEDLRMYMKDVYMNHGISKLCVILGLLG